MERLAGLNTKGSYTSPDELFRLMGRLEAEVLPQVRAIEAEHADPDSHGARDALFMLMVRDAHARGLTAEQLAGVVHGVCEVAGEVAAQTEDERCAFLRERRARAACRGVKLVATAALWGALAYGALFGGAWLDRDGDNVVTANDVQLWGQEIRSALGARSELFARPVAMSQLRERLRPCWRVTA